MKNFSSGIQPSGPKWAKMYVGTVKGAEQLTDDGEMKGVYSGLYTVKLDTGQVRKNVPYMPSSYSPSTNSGLMRMFGTNEPVIVAETNKGECYILGNAMLPFTDTRAPLPLVGGFNRPMKPGEVLIGGPSISVPKRVSYMFFDGSGGIEVKSNAASIKINGDRGNIEVSSYRHGLYTESGSETWGIHPLIGNSTPYGIPKPGYWRRLVRCKDSDNLGPFISTEQGNLGISAKDIDVNPETPLHFQNFNNKTGVIVSKSGSYSIIAGAEGIGSAMLRSSASSFRGKKALAPLGLELDVITRSATLKGDIVNIQGGLTGTEGSVIVKSARTSIISASSINLTTQGSVAIIANDVIIKASSTKLLGSVTIVGDLKVVGSLQALGGVSSTTVTAPFMSVDRT
jgi:hypothetical protein